jgi:V8-like Glu-specific endopeptidase
VVGYPGDVDGGDNMYEHWAVSKINLSHTGYLSYKIDTEGGESGSPVLKKARGGKGLDVPSRCIRLNI